MMRQILTIIAAVLISQSLFAQAPCGINHDDIQEITKRLLKNKESLKAGATLQRSGNTIWIPTKFHILGTSTGSQRIDEVAVLEQLADINEGFLDQNIQFYIDGDFNYIDNSAAFDNPSSGAGLLLLGQSKVNGRMNIFIPRTAMTGGGSIGTTLGFYSGFNDWIVIRQAEVNSQTSTLAHEIGHFLSLLHPHNGWDAVDYDPNIHTPTPVFSPGGVRTENGAQSGSCKNCEDAGDFLCDTPPDYNFGFGWNDCDYDAGTLDPCGDVIDVDENNYMGYFLRGCTSYSFSPQQKELMEQDIATRYNQNTILESLTPSTVEPVEGDFVVNDPEQGGTSYQSQSVWFDWDDIPGATNYIFEVSRFSNFTAATRVMLENGESNVLIEDPFISDTEYFWRVYPYNQSSTGYGWSSTATFTSGPVTSVNEISEISSFELFPNVLNAQGEVILEINSDESFDVSIELMDLGGRTIKSIDREIISGENKINLNIPSLTGGIYFVKLVSNRGILSKKLIVQ